MKTACLEAIGFRLGYIEAEQLLEQSSRLKNTQYGASLDKVAIENER